MNYKIFLNIVYLNYDGPVSYMYILIYLSYFKILDANILNLYFNKMI